MRMARALIVLLLTATSAAGGAWLRDEGAAFLSVSQTYGDAGDTYNTLLLEYGLTPGITLGFDVGGRNADDWQGVAFLRRPIGPGDGPARLAAEIGLGRSESEPLFRPGLSWGRGIETGWGPGWLALDTLAEIGTQNLETAFKADATLGIRPSDREMVILQIQAGDYPGYDPYLRIAPSYVRRIGESLHLELGVRAGLVGDDAAGFKLGTWLAF